jgi:hypothetical protein
VAGTLPALFFKDPSTPLTAFKNGKRTADQTVEGEDCYVLNGEVMGMKTILWVTKDTFLVKQKQMVLGGKSTMPEMTDAKVEEGLKKMGNLSPGQKAQAKAMAKNMKPMLAKAKGTITETYRDIEFNQPLKQQDFNYVVPAGMLLSDSVL